MKKLAMLVLCACGSTSGPAQPDATIATVQSITITPNTLPTLTARLDAPVKLTAMAMLSTGTSRDVTDTATWASSDPSIASVDGGLVTPLAAGTATITVTAGMQSAMLAANVKLATLAVANVGNGGIDFFAPDADGNIAPLRSIRGPTTTLGAAWELTVHGDELIVADGANNAIVVFPLNLSGDGAPLRRIAGATTGLATPESVAFYKDELYVVNEGASTITVYPAGGTGDIAPTRTIAGAMTGLTVPVVGIEVLNDEIFVADQGTGAILVFPTTANGNVMPSRSIVGTHTGLAGSLGVRHHEHEIFVAGTNNAMVVFEDDANGNVAPLRKIIGAMPALSSPGQLAIIGTDVYIASYGNNSIRVFDAYALGNVAPKRVISGAATNLANPIGAVAF